MLLSPILCTAQLNFPSSLTNELDQTSIDYTTRNLIVLIHGWNPDGESNAFQQGQEWNNLVTQLKATSLAGNGWKLAEYHWESDANTGPAFEVLDPAVGYGNATVAAVRAQQHGDNLASILQSQTPNLRRVHFIAHSAGSWVAQEALKAFLAANPYCVAQMTLLDPFIPDASFGMNVGLSDNVMSDTAMLLTADRIYCLENYYADDSPTGGWDCSKGQNGPTVSTQERFAWRDGIDTNLMIDWGGPVVNPPEPWRCSPLCAAYYDWHSGPIQFYGDTVQAGIPHQIVPAGLSGSGCPFVYGQVGWFRSLFSERNLLPQITGHPATQTAAPRETVTLSVVASGIGPFNYQWYKNGSVILGPTGASYSFTASAEAPAAYVVRVGNANGYTFSDKAIVSIYASAPTITSISPPTLPPSSSPQLITIHGTNFKLPGDPNASSLVFYDLANNPHAYTPINVTATSMQCNLTVQSATGTWKVKVVNGGAESALSTFNVIPASAQLTGLSISGPGSVPQNSSGQYTATAIFSDGSTPTVTPTWSLNIGAPASISTSGQLMAGSVSANTLVTITGSYPAGGVTKTASCNVNIAKANNTGTQTMNLIVNSDFESGSSGWTLSGGAAITNFAGLYHSATHYLWLGGAINEADLAYQMVTIPLNATAATLSFYYNINSLEGNTVAYDVFSATICDTNGTLLETVGNWSNMDQDQGPGNPYYHQKTFNLLQFAGRTIGVVFASANNSSRVTNFRVDDVSVQVTAPASAMPVLFGIGGPTSVTEGGWAQYNAIVVYGDGSVQSVTPSWSVSGPATISSSGYLNAGSVSSDTTATVTGNYSGFPALNYPITIVNVAPVCTSLAISGPSSVNENSTAQFSAAAIYSDGTSQPASVSWSVPFGPIPGPGSISSSGLFTVGEVSSDTTTTVSASCAIGGVTHTTTQQVTVLTVIADPWWGQYNYTTNNDTITITRYTGPGGALTIPSIINGLPVTSVGDFAFAGCPNLTSVTISNNITKIGEGPFAGCPSLSVITVDPHNAFCSIVDGVLFDKNQTTLIQYPAGKAGSYYAITNSVTRIGNGAFADCNNLTSITIPTNVTSIGAESFYSCSNLTSVTIPNSVTGIGADAFYYCTSLTGVTIPDSVTNIDSETFRGCSSLTSLTTGNGVTSIAYNAFWGCTSVTNVTIGYSVTNIGSGGSTCDGFGALDACTSLPAITVDPLNPAYSSLGGVLLDKTQTTVIEYPVGKAGAYTIPNSVTSIGAGAFYECSSLTSVTIPNSVTSIGSSAFSSCTSLNSIAIGSSVTSIGDGAFVGCTSLTSVTIPNSVTSIGSSAFSSCTSLTSLTIPNSVTSIGDSAFISCTSLSTVTIGNSVTNIGSGAFILCTNLTGVYFKSNAPSVDWFVFDSDHNATAYYLPGTTGWGSVFGAFPPGEAGVPTVLWNPQVQTSGGSFGVRTNQFGFNITWASGMVVVVEACENPANPVWSPLQTNTLSGDSFYFSDPQWTNYPARLYRLRSP